MPYCGECKQECKVSYTDEGIGGYEYQGFRGHQSIIVAVSHCCEADVFEDEECTRQYEADFECDYIPYDEEKVDEAIENAIEYQKLRETGDD